MQIGVGTVHVRPTVALAVDASPCGVCAAARAHLPVLVGEALHEPLAHMDELLHHGAPDVDLKEAEGVPPADGGRPVAGPGRAAPLRRSGAGGHGVSRRPRDSSAWGGGRRVGPAVRLPSSPWCLGARSRCLGPGPRLSTLAAAHAWPGHPWSPHPVRRVARRCALSPLFWQPLCMFISGVRGGVRTGSGG